MASQGIRFVSAVMKSGPRRLKKSVPCQRSPASRAMTLGFFAFSAFTAAASLAYPPVDCSSESAAIPRRITPAAKLCVSFA